ncbi:1855_t:CDS:2, partial [Acaulospora colombiana]
MYQTAAAPQYQPQQPFAVYGNTHITYTSNPHHSRNSSTSSISRHSPQDASFALETNGYTQLSYRFDPNTAANTMTTQDVSKSSPLQQNHNSPSLIQAGSSPSSSVTLSPDNSSNVLPPISEVFSSSSAHNGQSTSSSGSPIQSQVVPQQPQVQSQQQPNGGNITMPSTASAHPSYFYSDVNAAAAAATFAAAAHAQQVAAQQAAEGANFSTSIVSQSQSSQLASNIPVVDPRTLPRVSANASDMQALSNRNGSSMLAINTAGLSVGAGDPSPMSANSSTGSPIMPTLSYHPSAHHQALLNSHFMAATQSMNSAAGLIAPTQRLSANHNRRNTRSDDGSDINSVSNGERPQKVYSFVALPGINTKKRPRRRYDEIERHYACNFAGCTKSYGTLNHLNAHVQMQKHGPKRHPSEFKELRKQWRRQKREEEERKNAESAAAKNSAAGLNIT